MVLQSLELMKTTGGFSLIVFIKSVHIDVYRDSN